MKAEQQGQSCDCHSSRVGLHMYIHSVEFFCTANRLWLATSMVSTEVSASCLAVRVVRALGKFSNRVLFRQRLASVQLRNSSKAITVGARTTYQRDRIIG